MAVGERFFRASTIRACALQGRAHRHLRNQSGRGWGGWSNIGSILSKPIRRKPKIKAGARWYLKSLHPLFTPPPRPSGSGRYSAQGTSGVVYILQFKHPSTIQGHSKREEQLPDHLEAASGCFHVRTRLLGQQGAREDVGQGLGGLAS
jgi:hypothetical protein